MDPHSRAPKKNTSHGNEVLPQDTTHLIQRPYYYRGSPCQDPEGNRTTRRPPDHGKETQTAVIWSCFPFFKPGKAQWKGEEDKADRGIGGKRTSGNGQASSSARPRGQRRTGENGEEKKNGYKIICGALTTLAVRNWWWWWWWWCTELAHSFLFCSFVYSCLYGPLNCISFHKLSQQLSFLTLLFRPYLCLIGPFSYISPLKVSSSPGITHSGWLGSKHQITNYPWSWTFLFAQCSSIRQWTFFNELNIIFLPVSLYHSTFSISEST